MLAKVASLFHRARRGLSRSEWAIKHFEFESCQDSGENPGLLIIQIDGLGRGQLEQALSKGEMPFLQSLKDNEQYRLYTFYSGIPSTTPAVQAELYYGVRAGVPAFSFRDRSLGKIGAMFDSDWAKKFEAQFARKAEGLLKDGSSWSNIYCGGAAAEESHFCVACLGLGNLWRIGKLKSGFVFILLQFLSFIRIAGLLILELIIGIADAIGGILQGKTVFLEFGMVFSRMFVGIGLREIMRIGGSVDVTRGLPVVHLNFLGYDELSHRRGPDSWYAHWALRGIDRAIKSVYFAAHRSIRRDYQVWIFSDHGQECTRAFAEEFSGGIEKIIEDCLKDLRFLDRDAPGKIFFSVAAMGPVGHLYFSVPINEDQKIALARCLVTQGQVPGVLRLAADGGITWHHRHGETAVPKEVPALLKNHPPALRLEIADDLITFCKNVHAGDLILLGWNPQGTSWSFASERGAHAGPGIHEIQGFLFVPPSTRLPTGSKDFIRPSGLRKAALALLGRQRFDNIETESDRSPSHLRVMSYNVHSCIGMDGRISPRRIARVIAGQFPDIVALQELDHGRPRSRGEDQARTIANELGLHVAFYPAIVQGAERYGHAVFSRWPIEIVKMAELPGRELSIWREPRGAWWMRIWFGEILVNFVTTHLGLSHRERMAQIMTLLGSEWLGPLLASEPIIFCGDFNFSPNSTAHRLVKKSLRDVSPAAKRRVHTFSSARLFTQLDHIFISPHFDIERVFVPRNHLTSVASDHLPLIADLKTAPNPNSAHRDHQKATPMAK